MSEQQPNIQNQPEEAGLNIKEYLFWAWEKKWWILLSVALCLFVAIYYVYVTPKQYVRTASVMMKSDSRGNANISELSAFKELGIGGMSVDVLNEIEAFKAPILMERVVRRLNLDVEYYGEGLLKDNLLYGNSPVKVSFENNAVPAGFTFRISKVDSTSVRLSSFKYKGEDVDFKPLTVALNDTVSVPFGNMVVSPTLLFSSKDFDFDVRVNCYDAVALSRRYLGMMNIALAQKQTSVIKLGMTDISIRRADDVINTLIDVYNEEWINYMNESTVNTSHFINDRLVVIEQELNVADSDIERFKRENELFDISAEAQQKFQESSLYSSQYFQINNQLSVARYISEYMNDSKNSSALLPANSGIENSNVESQIDEYNKLMLRRNTLVANSSENNPLVSDYNSSLEMMHSSILTSLQNLIASLRLQLDNIEKRETNIRDRIAKTPGQAKELVNIERQQKVKEQLYLYLLQKREENELSSALVVNNTRVLSYATGNGVPVTPKSMMIFAVAFVIGFALPFGYKILRDLLDTTVRGRKDLESLVAPFVGEIPFVGKRKQFLCFTREVSDVNTENPVVVSAGNTNMINEAFRVVRSNLDFMKHTGNKKSVVTMFTSYNVNSGKTFIAANLSAIMSVRGDRTVVIDLDMRKANLSRMVGRPDKGISSYLGGYVDNVNDIIVKYPKVENLDVIPVGVLPPNPVELLQSDRLDKLVDELRSKYDRIFIDCPPIDIVADTSIISRLADVTLFVVRTGLMERALIGEINGIYNSGRLNNMAVLLNGTKRIHSKYGYHYGYGYGYGYGHGYYRENKK